MTTASPPARQARKPAKRQPGFCILPSAVCRAWPALSPSAKAIAIALAMTLDNETLVATPTVARLSELSGIRRCKSVYAAIRELVEKTGLLTEKRFYHLSNTYSWEGRQDVAESATSYTPKTWRKTPLRRGGKRHPHIYLDSLSRKEASQKNGIDEIAKLYEND